MAAKSALCAKSPGAPISARRTPQELSAIVRASRASSFLAAPCVIAASQVTVLLAKKRGESVPSAGNWTLHSATEQERSGKVAIFTAAAGLFKAARRVSGSLR
eukprot:2781200-Alexandrium_andersonii.AAC.1